MVLVIEVVSVLSMVSINSHVKGIPNEWTSERNLAEREKWVAEWENRVRSPGHKGIRIKQEQV
jgi:hypothetical protein